MLFKNEFEIEPGVWISNGTSLPIVVTEMITHKFSDGIMVQLEEPLVVYRDLEISIEKTVMYSMTLTDFKNKFHQERSTTISQSAICESSHTGTQKKRVALITRYYLKSILRFK